MDIENLSAGGNILRKDAYSYTTGSVSGNGVYYWLYTYDSAWKDQLKTVTKYNQSDVALIDHTNAVFTYDAIGNPLSDGTWTYTWEKGKQLKSMHNAATGVTMEFKYNHEGIRTQKVKKVNGIVTETTDYILKGKTVEAMKKNTDTYYFTYDTSGAPATVNFNGADYTYVKNFQGDIVGILDASGDLVVEYMYDAWGDAVSIYSASTTIDPLAFDNPFRYRGYVWDDVTGLYYLNSRYYNPELGRFDNADTYVISNDNSLFGTNMFAYCLNNPVHRSDISGTYSVEIFDSKGNLLTDDILNFDGGRVSIGVQSGTWDAFMRSMQDGLSGLEMAAGQRDPTHVENHHVISDKRVLNPECQEILDRYDYPLKNKKNIIQLPYHRGRHTDAYHGFIYSQVKELDFLAKGNSVTFAEGMGILGKFIQKYPLLPYAQPKK